jgi:hypothetical protein
MSVTRSRWLLPFLSVCTTVALFAGPIAWADDDEHGDHGGDRGKRDDRVTLQVTAPNQTVVHRDDEDENEVENNATRADALVAALNNQVAMLGSREVEIEDADEAPEVGAISSLTLAGLETGLSTADATRVTNAVNANTAALQTFLNNNTLTANAIKTTLSAAGLNPANVLAVLASEDRLIAITA